MAIEKEAYLLSLSYAGEKEIKGTGDNPLIELAHIASKYFKSTVKASVDTDAVPWCSSWVCLCIIGANIKRNPWGAYRWLETSFDHETIKKFFKFARVKLDVHPSNLPNTLAPIVFPKVSASSLSWDTWGEAVDISNAKRGDLVRFTRDGGGHIAWLDEDAIGKVWVRCHGGNQDDQVCSKNYARYRLKHVRRHKL